MAAKRTPFLDGAAPLLLILGVVAFVAIVGVMRFGGLPGAPISPDEERSLVGQAAGPRPIPLRETVTCAFVGGNGTRSCVSKYGQCATAGPSCTVAVAGAGGSVVQWTTTNCAGATGQSVIDGKDQTITFTCGAACTNECTAGASRCFNATSTNSCGNYDADPCTEWGGFSYCAPGTVCQSGSCVPSCTNECTMNSSQCVNATYIRFCGNFDADSCSEWGSTNSCGIGMMCEGGSCVSVPPPCTNECAMNSSQCVDDSSFRICGNFDADACTEWGATAGCAPGMMCQSGSCIPSCTNECADGTTQCGNTTDVFRCGNYDPDPCTEWTWLMSCSTGSVCESGTCTFTNVTGNTTVKE